MDFGEIFHFNQLYVSVAADEARGYSIIVIPVGNVDREIEILELHGLNITRTYSHIRLGYSRRFSSVTRGLYHILDGGYNVHIVSDSVACSDLPKLVKADGLVALITAEDGDNVIFRGSYREVLE